MIKICSLVFLILLFDVSGSFSLAGSEGEKDCDVRLEVLDYKRQKIREEYNQRKKEIQDLLKTRLAEIKQEESGEKVLREAVVESKQQQALLKSAFQAEMKILDKEINQILSKAGKTRTKSRSAIQIYIAPPSAPTCPRRRCPYQ